MVPGANRPPPDLIKSNSLAPTPDLKMEMVVSTSQPALHTWVPPTIQNILVDGFSPPRTLETYLLVPPPHLRQHVSKMRIHSKKELHGVDLYSADDHPGPSTNQQPQVKVEGQEAVDMPLIPRHSHLTRAQVRSQRHPFKCFTCNNQFERNQHLRNHLIKYPHHRGDEIRPPPTQRQSTKSIKKHVRRARVQK